MMWLHCFGLSRRSVPQLAQEHSPGRYPYERKSWGQTVNWLCEKCYRSRRRNQPDESDSKHHLRPCDPTPSRPYVAYLQQVRDSRNNTVGDGMLTSVYLLVPFPSHSRATRGTQVRLWVHWCRVCTRASRLTRQHAWRAVPRLLFVSALT